MPMKEWFRRLQPMQLYVILGLTIVFFVTELVVSHVTHALTLLMDSYHMLCNILALTGCIATIKYGKKNTDEAAKDTASELSSSGEELTTTTGCQDTKKQSTISRTRKNQENKLKNTFGWARIDVIAMLICCVFQASLCFSLIVEALQTLVHIDHHDEMHHPIPVLCIGGAGLLLNGVCYLLIGGYTFHQGSFLYVTETGDVVLDRVVVSDSVRKGERRLSRTRTMPSPPNRQRQGVREMSRDIFGCIYVIVCALFVYFTDAHVAKYIDPILSFFSALTLFTLSYPYMKESCLILLQTIPNSINIDSLCSELHQHFPDIVSIHDLHVWQLTATKVISTVHIIFKNPKVYGKIINDVKDFFMENGITQVTIQPEFYTKVPDTNPINVPKVPLCLMQCQTEDCKESHCCPNTEPKPLNNKLRSSKEIIPTGSTLDLKSIRVLDNEFSSSENSVNSINNGKDDKGGVGESNETNDDAKTEEEAVPEVKVEGEPNDKTATTD